MSNNNSNDFPLQTGNLSFKESAEIASFADPYTGISNDVNPSGTNGPSDGIKSYTDVATHDANVIARNYQNITASNVGKASTAAFDIHEEEEDLDWGNNSSRNPSPSADQKQAFKIESNNYNNLETKLNHFYGQESSRDFPLQTGNLNSKESAEIASHADPYTGISNDVNPSGVNGPSDDIKSYTDVATHDANVIAQNYQNITASNAGKASTAAFDIHEEEEDLDWGNNSSRNPSPSADQKQAFKIESNNYNNLETKLNHFYGQESSRDFPLQTGNLDSKESAEIASHADPYTGISSDVNPSGVNGPSDDIKSYTDVATHDANVIAQNYQNITASNAGKASTAAFDIHEEEEDLNWGNNSSGNPSPSADQKQAFKIESNNYNNLETKLNHFYSGINGNPAVPSQPSDNRFESDIQSVNTTFKHVTPENGLDAYSKADNLADDAESSPNLKSSDKQALTKAFDTLESREVNMLEHYDNSHDVNYGKGSRYADDLQSVNTTFKQVTSENGLDAYSKADSLADDAESSPNLKSSDKQALTKAFDTLESREVNMLEHYDNSHDVNYDKGSRYADDLQSVNTTFNQVTPENGLDAYSNAKNNLADSAESSPNLKSSDKQALTQAFDTLASRNVDMLESYDQNSNNGSSNSNNHPSQPTGNNTAHEQLISQDQTALNKADSAYETAVGTANEAVGQLQSDEGKSNDDVGAYEKDLTAVQSDVQAHSANTASDEDKVISDEQSVGKDSQSISSDKTHVDSDISSVNTSYQKDQQAEGKIKKDDPQGKHHHGGGYASAKSHDPSSHQAGLDDGARTDQSHQISEQWKTFNQQDNDDGGLHKGDFEKAVGDFASQSSKTPDNATTGHDGQASPQDHATEQTGHSADENAQKSTASGGAFSNVQNYVNSHSADNDNRWVGEHHHGHNREFGDVKKDLQNFKTADNNLENDLGENGHQMNLNNVPNDIDNLHGAENQVNHDNQYLCFTTGTMIKTIDGEKAVQDLKVGDIAITASGKEKTISWIGHQDVIFGEKDEKPVTIKKDAIANDVPYADLTTSSAHAFAFRASAKGWFGRRTKDVLVRASSLVNGVSIIQTADRTATYWHVGLEGGHDVLIANGAFAESFADHGERQFFSNMTSYKDTSKSKDCLPRMKRGKYVRSVNSFLNERAKGLFCARDNEKANGSC